MTRDVAFPPQRAPEAERLVVALTRAAFIAALVAAMDSANSVREPAGPTADVNTPAPDATEHATGAGAPDTTKARPACDSTPDLPQIGA